MLFDEENYLAWLEQLETDTVMNAAEQWGVSIAVSCTEGKTASLESFDQYMQREYAGCIADGGYGDDTAYDNLDRNGDRE
jgi:hypothetical protein